VFSPDGSRILGASTTGLHVWDVASGAITERLEGAAGGSIPGVVVDSSGVAIAGAGVGTIGGWDLGGSQRLGRRFVWGTGEGGCMVTLCTLIAPGARRMATIQGDGTVAMVDLRSGRLVHTFPARNGPVATGLAFTSDGRQLVTGGIAGTVTIWNAATGALVRRLRFEAPVFATAISPDARLLAVTRQADGARDAQVEVRELASGAMLFTRTIRGGAGDLQFSRDGRTLFALGCCRGGSTVAAWDARTGAPRFERTQEDHMTALAPLPDSRTLLVGDEDGVVGLWDARTGKPMGAPRTAAAGGVAQIAVSPDGRRFVVADFAGSAKLWDVATLERVGDEFPVSDGIIPAVAFASRGRLVITEPGSATVWPTDRPTLQRFACQVAGRNLTRDEWNDLLPTRPYRQLCPAR
jgi:WD40 repeat protein